MESFDDLQVGDKVMVCRFYYATPEKRVEGEVVGFTKRYVKVRFEIDNSDIGRNADKRTFTMNFKKDGGSEPGDTRFPPRYWLRHIKEQ